MELFAEKAVAPHRAVHCRARREYLHVSGHPDPGKLPRARPPAHVHGRSKLSIDDFERHFVKGMAGLSVGDPMQENTDIGPLATEKLLQDLENLRTLRRSALLPSEIPLANAAHQFTR